MVCMSTSYSVIQGSEVEQLNWLSYHFHISLAIIIFIYATSPGQGLKIYVIKCLAQSSDKF